MLARDDEHKRAKGTDHRFRFGEIARRHGLSVAFLLVVVLGTWAFESARQVGAQGVPLLDSLYRSLQMFVMGFSMPEGAKGNVFLSTVLTILSYSAVAVSSSAIIAVFARRLGDPLRLRWQAWRYRHGLPGWRRLSAEGCRPRKRAVLLGFGTVNRAIAQSLRAKGYTITAIDERFDEPAQIIARNNGVLLVAGDLTDLSSLERGWLGLADIIAVAAGNDVINIEIAAAAHSLEPTANIHAHVASASFADDLRESADKGFPLAEGIQTFSVKQESARNLLRRAHLAREAREHRQGQVHLIIIGMGDQGEAILLEALQSAISTDLAAPLITIVDKDAETVAARFRARHGGLFDPALPGEARPTIDFIALDVQTVDFLHSENLNPFGVSVAPATAYVFCCGEDATNLAAGLRLEHAMSLGRCAPAAIYLTVWGAGIDAEVYDHRDPLSYCKLFGAVEPTMAGAAFLNGDPDRLAEGLHAAYEKQRLADAQPGTPMRPWAGMPQTMKEANRRAVRHAHNKLIDLDLQWRGMGGVALPTIDADTARVFGAVPENLDSPGILDGRVAAMPEYQFMAKLAEAEHRRWLVDRAMDGWRPVAKGSRDNGARLHPNMVPFRRLDERDQHYDTVLVRALLEQFGSMHENTPVARRARRSALTIGEHAEVRGAIALGTTELILALPAQSYNFSEDRLAALLQTIHDWAVTPAACRVRLVLGQRFGVDIPHSAGAGSAAYLQALVRGIPEHIDLSVVRLYGAGPDAATPPGMMEAYLAEAIAGVRQRAAEINTMSGGG